MAPSAFIGLNLSIDCTLTVVTADKIGVQSAVPRLGRSALNDQLSDTGWS
jgi:hypothetical protein